MKKRYHIDALNKSAYGVTYYDACSKPHTDAEKIANSLGFESVYLYGSRLSKLGQPIWKKVLLHLYNLCWQVYVLWQTRKLNKINDADIFIQYGFTTEAMFSVVEKLKKNRNRIILLIHDLDSLRLQGKGSKVANSYIRKVIKEEKRLLNNVDVVIAHTQPMKERLREIGYLGRVELLEFFDYLNDNLSERMNSDIRENIDVVFAGNLAKSSFVKKLTSIKERAGYRYILYGKQVDDIATNDTVQYYGCFKNDDISDVSGTWGLVWDGEDIDTCKGHYGEYLKINSPFKFSLYLAMGIPVIVWEQSAMAYYVKKYGLGIVVGSLNEVYDKIHSLTDEEQNNIKHNVHIFSKRVKQGEMLASVLRKIN